MPELNKDNVRKWVAALRSGQYKQGDSCLYMRGVERYCCLGVACEISGVVRHAQDPGFYFDPDNISDIACNYLPKAVQAWLGVEEQNPIIGGQYATTLNDQQEKTFLQIADLIEEHWLKEV